MDACDEERRNGKSSSKRSGYDTLKEKEVVEKDTKRRDGCGNNNCRK